MNMAYTKSPERPHVRMEAVRLMRKGWSSRKVARHFGFDHSTIVRWMERAPGDRRRNIIPTLSSRPYSHPNALPLETVVRILEMRRERNQCAEILHRRLKDRLSPSPLSKEPSAGMR